ncbi:MAG: response regulator [Paucibacter sp.]|nr:response regulator [Roseateles sp.]
MPATVSEPFVVLFVDDEASILSALRRLFRPEGYRVLLAESGTAGLALLESEPVDLVVSDMRMPEMDGAAFLEQVRIRWPEVGRILLTGYSDISSTVAAVNRGEIHRYIAKPWDDRDLLLGVRDGMERRRLLLENRALQQLTHQQNEELKLLNADLAERVKARTSELEQVNGMLEKSLEQLQENFLLSIDVFSGLLELRRGGMAGYSRQVADLARRTARKLGSRVALEQDVYLAGLLHEIGKIGLPDALLGKPVSLMSGDELAQYREHTLLGETALLPLGQLQRAARFVRAQHERVDGKGFPDGLAGAEVPVGAQIVGAAADYFAALSGRMAVKRYTPAEARGLIRGGAGMRYAHEVVAAFELAVDEEPELVCRDREVLPADLEVGMELARDVLSPKGTLLLARGFVFDSRVIRQVREFSGREDFKLKLFIKLPEKQDGATVAARQLEQA